MLGIAVVEGGVADVEEDAGCEEEDVGCEEELLDFVYRRFGGTSGFNGFSLLIVLSLVPADPSSFLRGII